jgi:WD40 repeat protein
VYGLAWSPCGTKALTCGADKTCRLWEVRSSHTGPHTTASAW